MTRLTNLCMESNRSKVPGWQVSSAVDQTLLLALNSTFGNPSPEKIAKINR